jgi:hypothetical protein
MSLALRPRCFVCSTDTQKTCACGVYYCGAECQTQHWQQRHQMTCGAKTRGRDKSPKRKKPKEAEPDVLEQINLQLEVINRNLGPIQQIFHAVDPDQPERLTSTDIANMLSMHQTEIDRLKLKRRLEGLSKKEQQALREHTGQIVLLTAGDIVSKQFLKKTKKQFEQLLRLAQGGFKTSLEYLLWAKDNLPGWAMDVMEHAQSYKEALDPKLLTLDNVSAVLSKTPPLLWSGANSSVYLFMAGLRKASPSLRSAFYVLSRQLKDQLRSADLKKRVSILETELELLRQVGEDTDYDREDVERAIQENEAELRQIRGE